MSALDDRLVEEWQKAVGRQQVLRQTLEVESLRRYALAIDSDQTVEREAPPLGHWAFFLPTPSDAAIGTDGHPRRGGFLPAVTLPRRMFAASDIRFEAPFELGAAAEQVSTIASVNVKRGRSGDLVFVEVDCVLLQEGAVRVAERQSYVYRGENAPVALPERASGMDGEVWQPSTVNLFRFSAATFNGHRIHYDEPYATGVEGYPALVVHGPYTAARLAGFAARSGRLASFAFRAQSPLFVDQPIYLKRMADNEVSAIRCDGAVAMTAKVTYL